MMLRMLMFPTIALGALLQQALPGWPLLGGIKPPVLAAMTLHYALRKSHVDAALAIFFAALLQDGLELGSFGPALLAFPVVGIVAHRIHNEIFSDGLVTQLFLGGLLGLFTCMVALLVYTATGQRTVPPGLAFLRLFGALALGMATLPPVSRAINALEASLPKRKGYGWQ